MHQSLQKLLTLLSHAAEGAIAVALYDHPSVIGNALRSLREQIPGRVLELRVDSEHCNPIDLIRSVDRRKGDVICVFDLEKGFPQVLRYLDLQREVLRELGVPLVFWVTPSGYRDLVEKAPNFYRFRKTVLDFTQAARSAGSDASQVPRVFISSTVDDLRRYREAARDAAIGAGFLPVMMEYFTASGARPPLDECLKNVSEADVIVVIVGHRYGWVPPEQPPGYEKSITWLECERAQNEGSEILAFVIDDRQPWPEAHREEHDIAAAVREGKATASHLELVQARVARLLAFKEWLDGRGITVRFTTQEDLLGKVSGALHGWKLRHADEFKAPTKPEVRAADPGRYLRSLLDQTAYIDIRGLQVGTGKAYRFPIEDLYMTLTTTRIPETAEEKAEGKADIVRGEPGALQRLGTRDDSSVSLNEVLPLRRVVVVGDPGSGKTTFLRRVASTLCQTLLGEVPDASRTRLGLSGRQFPMLVRLADLAQYIVRSRRDAQARLPSTEEAAGWLPRFLGDASRDGNWALDEGFFRDRLEVGRCALLLDGLDEVPDRVSRGSLSRLIENVSLAYEKCMIVVTSRPAAFVGEAVLHGFAHARIEPLEEEAIRTFLDRWSRALFPESPEQARLHRDELAGALVSLPEIRRLARNPVMLTALAVVHWNEKRLPEQRADLYDSIISWLSRSREQRVGRLLADQCVAVLQELALAMHDHREGRQVQVARHWAAEQIAEVYRIEVASSLLAGRWGAEQIAEGPAARVTRQTVERAERFLEEEELDSGIVVGRGNEIRFWHLTFQEYLAARAIAGRSEAEQHGLLFKTRGKLYRQDWREVILQLAGVLHQQGRQKVDGFVGNVLDGLGKNPGLADQARTIGLLGAVLRDLKPLAYQINDARYERLRDTVLGIFERKRSKSVSIKERVEAADALGQAGDPRLDPGDPGRWVSIPEGTFWMGAQDRDPELPGYDSEAYEWEGPVREVYLDAYKIGRYPVTVAEYRSFVAHGGYDDEKWWKEGGFGKSAEPRDWEDQLSYPNRPVVGVSWYEAAAYAAWAGCDLPTEAEWERAARGVGGRKYPWGNEPPEPSRANYDETKIGHPTPVGIFPLGATPEGIHDLAGNVWEWCKDWFAESYSEDDLRNPIGPQDRQYRVLRGGSWGSHSGGVRSADRGRVDPDGRLSSVGFRVVLVGVRTP